MKDRIKEIRRNLDLTQQAFATKINLTKSAIAHMESGNRNPSERTLADICRNFNINYDWLRFGTGQMKKESQDVLDTKILDILNVHAVNVNSYMHRLKLKNAIYCLITMAPDKRATLIEFLDDIIGS